MARMLYGKFYWSNNDDVNNFKLQLFVIKSHQKTAFKYCHDVPSAGHLGPDKMLSRIQQLFYLLSMKSLITRYCKECDHCAVRKSFKRNSSNLEEFTCTHNTGVHTFSTTIDGELRLIINAVIARKFSITEEYIADIKTSDELLPGKHLTLINPKPLSLLKTPLTSSILLQDDSEEDDKHQENKKVTSQSQEEKRKQEKEKLRFHTKYVNRKEQETSMDHVTDREFHDDNNSLSEPVRKLLRKGGIPLFPAGRKEWDQEEVVKLITIPAVALQKLERKDSREKQV
ncbi:unnamed protein product [Mytilus coruscus]|uniref:Integrase zinc-binding domain-containing protein n=1 Tax=Mytilus coruscus TaxID=42192 RepID=A0A6J8DIE2_MYTCO|nr:unnamed protein product [Mytilus coruscus]